MCACRPYIRGHTGRPPLLSTNQLDSNSNDYDRVHKIRSLPHNRFHGFAPSLDDTFDWQQQQRSMRTEMVIRMQGGSEKGHAAMKVAAAVEGVESVTLSGKDKSILRVVGDGVDSNHLTTRLRRKVGRADLVELRTLHGGYSSRAAAAGSGLSRVDSTTGYGGSSRYGYGSYSYPAATTTGGYAPEYYGYQQQPSYYPAAAYGYGASPTVVHHEYYPPSADPNGCSIM
ncbi:unnamed protein product [Urochloa humidicola]